jgi:hypothetical protein
MLAMGGSLFDFASEGVGYRTSVHQHCGFLSPMSKTMKS